MTAVAPNADLGCELAGPGGDVVSLGCLAIIIKNVVEVTLLFLGSIALILLLWGSVQLLLSRGDPKALQAAKGRVTFTILGLVAILGTFIVVSVLTNALGFPDILQNFTLYQK